MSTLAVAGRARALSWLRTWIAEAPVKPFQLAISNQAFSKEEWVSHDPATGQALVSFKATDSNHLEVIMQEAAAAQLTWAQIPPLERAKLLHNVANLVREDLTNLVDLETLDTGKPWWEAKQDISACADSLDLFAGFIPTLGGSHVPVPPNPASFYYTRKEPFGVCGGIGAWNFPLQMAVWKSAPALAAGNALVFKPSELTPLSAVRLSELYTKAGCPAGLFSVVLGGRDIGQALVNHPKVAKVTFTGSTVGGRAVLQTAASRVIPGTLELGGKSALLVMADANLEEAVKGALMANFYTQGEVCSNASRVFVHSSVCKEFTQKLVDAVKKLTVGDPFDEATCNGAMITKQHAETVMNYISGAVKEGAKCLVGGEFVRFDSGSPLAGGFFISPCVMNNCHDDMLAVKEEIFGPVITLLEFQSEEEVVKRANASEYGLAGGVFTSNLATAHRIAAQLQCGSVYVNSYNMYPPGIPFGGYKQSGFGRENALETLSAYTQVKAVFVEGGSLPIPFPC